MAQKVKVGMIGCGGIAGGHIQRLLSIPEASVAAVMDPDPARLDAVKRRFPDLAKVPVFDDHKALLEEVELDATVICSPHFAHYEQIVDSLRAGLHVLTEKPMVCTIEDARSVMAEEEKAGKLVAISYQRHCQGPYQFVRNAIRSGRAGQVKFIAASQGQAWLQGQRGTWRQSKSLSCGGQLNDSGSHLIDIMLWITDLEAEEVTAKVDCCGTEVDINSSVSVRFRNGALASIAVVGSSPDPRLWENLIVVCEKWAFYLPFGQPLSYSTGLNGELHQVDAVYYGARSPDHNFIDAILGRAEVLAPSACGLRTIELTEAAWRSSETGETVRL